MGAFLDKPKTDKQNKAGMGNGLRYGLCSMQGWRVEMEDAHSAVIGLPYGLKDWSFFAVFDGHAGAKVSAFCAEKLLAHILDNEDFRSKLVDADAAAEDKDKDKDAPPQFQPSLDDVKKGIKTGFLQLDEMMRAMPEMVSGEDKSGSTAVCCILSPEHIFFANCGDSRAVLCRNGKCSFATMDHKPVNPEEKERIQNAGGSVMIQRVNGSLAVSRALGDFEYKNVDGKGPCEQLVSPEPEIFIEDRCPEDQFLVLACDGIWDVMSNEELCAFVENRLKITDSLEQVSNSVVDTCLYKGSRDNMSIVIVAMEGCPKVCDTAVRNEMELDRRLEAKIQELLLKESPENQDLPYIMHMLATELDDSFPPGGGLAAKKGFIERTYNRLRPHVDQEIQK